MSRIKHSQRHFIVCQFRFAGKSKTHIYLLHTCNLCNFQNRKYKMELTVKPDNVCICRCMSSMAIKFFASKQFDFVF